MPSHACNKCRKKGVLGELRETGEYLCEKHYTKLQQVLDSQVGAMAEPGGFVSSVDVTKIQTFYPTMEEFRDFPKYIDYIESQGANKAGLAKIVPPKEWKASSMDYNEIDMVIPAPISQMVSGSQGLYQQYNIQKKAMTVKEFAKLANSAKYRTPLFKDFEDLERKYWRNVTYNQAIYGADISGSIYDKDVKEWNINGLGTILDAIDDDYGITIEGVNTAYLYFGMWKTTFPWHTEDMDLYSINYLHFGAPKFWYTVPPEHGRRLERLAAGFFPGSSTQCAAFLRHKMTIISPNILRKYSIPYDKIVHYPNEFMITFPYGYHMGYNTGYNCAESTNFATKRWIEYGKRCMICQCSKDMVKINMDIFVKRYQPEKFELWKAGKDIAPHPEEKDKRLCLQRTPKKAKEENNLLDETPDDKTKLKGVTEKSSGDKSLSLKYEQLIDSVARLPPSQPEPDALRTQHSSSQLIKYRFTLSDEHSKSPLLKYRCVKSEPNLPATTSVNSTSESIQSTDVLVRGDVTLSSMSLNSSSQTVFIKQEVDETGNMNQEMSDQMKQVDSNDIKPEKRKLDTGGDYSSGEPLSKKSINDELKTEITEDVPGDYELGPPPTLFPYDTQAYEVIGDSEIPPSAFVSTINMFHAYSSKAEPAPPVPSTSGLDLITKVANDILNGKRVVSPNGVPLHPEDDSASVSSNDAKVFLVLPHKKGNKKQARRHPIHKTSKLVDPPSSSEDDVVEEQNMEPWARKLSVLWQSRRISMEAEIEYNREQSLEEPHCAVCCLLRPVEDSEEKRGKSPKKATVQPDSLPGRTAPWVPELCFTSGSNPNITEGEELNLDDEMLSPLLVCSQCSLCVHASCYGVLGAREKEEWLCERCTMEQFDAECCLCTLRGGAIKPTTDGRWAHIVCVIVIPEASFENAIRRGPVVINKIPPARLRLKCVFCHDWMKRSLHSTHACIQCSAGKCSMAFHVTCAIGAGMPFETSGWPYLIYVTCPRHSGKKAPPPKKPDLKLGDSVIAKHKNGRYYRCEIISITKQLFYEVDFDDGSYSEDLFPQDLVSHDCLKDGPPPSDTRVEVKWTDEIVYGGIYKGTHERLMYLVEFEDGSELTVKQIDVYGLDEKLPKKVKSRYSLATERRHEDIFAEQQKVQTSKRQRIANSKYLGEELVST